MHPTPHQSFPSSWGCVLCAILLFACVPQRTTAQSSPSAVKGVLGRAEVVFSGDIQYTLNDQVFLAGGPKYQDAKHFVFMFPSWIVREEEGGGVQLNHNGKYIEYVLNPQPDGAIIRNVVVRRPQSPDDPPPAPPFFAGTFWHKRTREFIRDRVRQAHRAGEATIAGVPTIILEWKVSRPELTPAFGGFNDLTQDGGLLRVYAAPSLGYVLPRIEFLGGGGKVMDEYQAEGFHEVAQGLYFPTTMSCNVYNSHGLVQTTLYRLTAVSHINEPIPDSEFQIDIPRGTTVMDERSGKSALIYRTGDVGLPADVASELGDVMSMPPNSVQANSMAWWEILAAGFVAGCVLFALYLIVLPRLYRRRT